MILRRYKWCSNCTNVSCPNSCPCKCHGPLGRQTEEERLEYVLRALEPFAVWAKALLEHGELEFLRPLGDPTLSHQPTVGDVRRAQQAFFALVDRL